MTVTPQMDYTAIGEDESSTPMVDEEDELVLVPVVDSNTQE